MTVVGGAWRLDCPAHGPRPAVVEARAENRAVCTMRTTCGRRVEMTDRDLYKAGAR